MRLPTHAHGFHGFKRKRIHHQIHTSLPHAWLRGQVAAYLIVQVMLVTSTTATRSAASPR